MQDLEVAASSYFCSWMHLAATAYGSPLDSTKMFWPVALPRKSRFRAAAKFRAVKLENEYNSMSTSDPAKESILHEKNFDASTVSTKIIVGADSEKSVTHTRVATAEALGIFASKLSDGSLHVVIDPLWNDLISLSGVQRQVIPGPSLSLFFFLPSLLLNMAYVLHVNTSASLSRHSVTWQNGISFQVAAMVLFSWFKELRSTDSYGTQRNLLVLPEHLRQWLLELLACSDPAFPTKDTLLPYAELSRTYAKMRNEASLLLQSAGSSGLFQTLISNINVNLDTLSADDALNFASKLSFPSDIADTGTSEMNVIDDIKGLKERLLATAGYLKCVQVHY